MKADLRTWCRGAGGELMTRFRKKPVVIDAWCFDPGAESPVWLSDAFNSGAAWYQGGEQPYITIQTLEGTMHANLGDWIVRGTAKELYPVKAGIFVDIYEPAEDE